jgi:hypothetical protein
MFSQSLSQIEHGLGIKVSIFSPLEKVAPAKSKENSASETYLTFFLLYSQSGL